MTTWVCEVGTQGHLNASKIETTRPGRASGAWRCRHKGISTPPRLRQAELNDLQPPRLVTQGHLDAFKIETHALSGRPKAWNAAK